MLLLPDIRIEENILSIQDPYILNGSIITNCEIETCSLYTYARYTSIRLGTENGCWAMIPFDKLEFLFKRAMDDFIAINGTDACVEGRRDIINWREYTISQYLNDIGKQCENIRESSYAIYGDNYYIEILKRDLRRQGRMQDNRHTLYYYDELRPDIDENSYLAQLFI